MEWLQVIAERVIITASSSENERYKHSSPFRTDHKSKLLKKLGNWTEEKFVYLTSLWFQWKWCFSVPACDQWVLFRWSELSPLQCPCQVEKLRVAFIETMVSSKSGHASLTLCYCNFQLWGHCVGGQKKTTKISGATSTSIWPDGIQPTLENMEGWSLDDIRE